MKKKERYNSLEELYLNTYRLVYIFISDYIRDWYVAEDIASIIWVKVSECADKYLDMDITHLHNYLRIMVQNEVNDYYRKKNCHDNNIERAGTSIVPPRTLEEEYVLQENLDNLERAKNTLSEEDRRLLALRFDAGLSARETGKDLGISEGAVRVRQHRILAKLKKEFETPRFSVFNDKHGRSL